MPEMKPEFPPLLSPGIHELDIPTLESSFVTRFSDSGYRPRLFGGFKVLLQRLTDLGIPFEVWIDGSFATEKPDPEDIDALFIFDQATGDSASSEVQRELAVIFGEDGRIETRLRYGCDVYLILANDDKSRSYWRGWFGFTRDEKPKGIPCIKVSL